MKKEQQVIKNINNIIPVLNTNVRIYPFDANHVLIESNNHQLKIKKQFELLINLVDGINSISQICENYKIQTNQPISQLFVYNLFYSDLALYGIIKSDLPIKAKERELHLRLSFIFWKGKSLSFISNLLSSFFIPYIFYSLLTLMFLFSLFILFFFKSNQNNFMFSYSNIFVFVSCSFIILMLHELGHVAACNKFGANHKGIGFGFYLFSPVFFADVSDAWKLPTKQRMIVNLGGIYIEFIIVTILFIVFLITNSPVLFYIGIALLIHIGVNLNPFLRYDGYWLLSDITNTSNLRSKSIKTLKNSFYISRLKRFSFADFLLAMYALVSYISIAIFLFFIFYYDSQSVLGLPSKSYKWLTTLTINKISYLPNILDQFFHNIVPILFYLFIFRLTYRLIKNFFKKKVTNEK